MLGALGGRKGGEQRWCRSGMVGFAEADGEIYPWALFYFLAGVGGVSLSAGTRDGRGNQKSARSDDMGKNARTSHVGPHRDPASADKAKPVGR